MQRDSPSPKSSAALRSRSLRKVGLGHTQNGPPSVASRKYELRCDTQPGAPLGSPPPEHGPCLVQRDAQGWGKRRRGALPLAYSGGRSHSRLPANPANASAPPRTAGVAATPERSLRSDRRSAPAGSRPRSPSHPRRLPCVDRITARRATRDAAGPLLLSPALRSKLVLRRRPVSCRPCHNPRVIARCCRTIDLLDHLPANRPEHAVQC
jgi:hypothetical protein